MLCRLPSYLSNFAETLLDFRNNLSGCWNLFTLNSFALPHLEAVPTGQLFLPCSLRIGSLSIQEYVQSAKLLRKLLYQAAFVASSI